MTTDRESLDPAVAARLFLEHAGELERFLVGVLRDRELARDVLQVTFTRLLDSGGSVRTDARKAWLFQVAYREALAARRRAAVAARALRNLAHQGSAGMATGEAALVRREVVDAVRSALRRLPAKQRAVVRLRVYEGKTFKEIAAELEIPLGTALARMRAALAKLRIALRSLE